MRAARPAGFAGRWWSVSNHKRKRIGSWDCVCVCGSTRTTSRVPRPVRRARTLLRYSVPPC